MTQKTQLAIVEFTYNNLGGKTECLAEFVLKIITVNKNGFLVRPYISKNMFLCF